MAFSKKDLPRTGWNSSLQQQKKVMKQIDTTGRESSTETASKTSSATRNWKRLEQKYIDYIDLLKSKISKTERKLATESRNIAFMKCLDGLACSVRSRYAAAFLSIRKAAEIPADCQRQFNYAGVSVACGEIQWEIAALCQKQAVEAEDRNKTHKAYGIARALEKVINKTKMETFLVLKQSFSDDPVDNVETRLQLLQAQFLSQADIALAAKGQLTKTQSFINSIIKENSRLRVELHKARKTQHKLERQLTLNNEQREKENAKKTQGLQLLAEDLRERDQRIRELTKQLEYYDEQEMCRGGKLLTPATLAQYQLEVQKLEEDIDKLIDEKMHNQAIQKDEIKRLNDKIVHFGELEQLRLNLEAEVEKFRKIKFDLEYQNISLKSEKEDLKSKLGVAELRDEEISKLELAQKQSISQLCKIHRILNNTSTDDSFKVTEMRRIIQNPLSLQRKQSTPSQILRAVDRLIEDPEAKDQSEQFQGQVKIQLQNLSSKIKLLRESSTKSSSNKDEKLFDSVMYIFPEPKKPAVGGQDKLLREKCRLEEQILELKEKSMHIRKIILQLVRALELRKVPRHVEGIMGVLFELFEYSEEEREQMVNKKSRGLFRIF